MFMSLILLKVRQLYWLIEIFFTWRSNTAGNYNQSEAWIKTNHADPFHSAVCHMRVDFQYLDVLVYKLRMVWMGDRCVPRSFGPDESRFCLKNLKGLTDGIIFIREIKITMGWTRAYSVMNFYVFLSWNFESLWCL